MWHGPPAGSCVQRFMCSSSLLGAGLVELVATQSVQRCMQL